MRNLLIFIIVSLGLGLGLGTFAQAAPLREQMVVMVDAHYVAGRIPEAGAGLIVSQTSTRTVIVTAKHVVRDETGKTASKVSVEFSQLRGRMYPAEFSDVYFDEELDLAVLFIDHRPGLMPPLVLANDQLKQLSPTQPERLAGSDVQVIGAMGQKRWAVGPANDKVLSADARGVFIKSEIASTGASGGGVFDRNGNLIAMSSKIDSSKIARPLNAKPMKAILRRLQEWRIEASLQDADMSGSTQEFAAQVARDVQLVVETIDAEIREKQGQQHRLNLRAVLSPAIANLRPDIEVRFPLLDEGRGAHMVLRPPSYSSPVNYPAVLEARATVVFPDGRRVGLVSTQLDFLTPLRELARKGKEPDFEVKRLEDAHRFFLWNLEQTREARAGAQQIAAESKASLAADTERAFREQLPKVFHSWGLSCKKSDDEPWTCGRASYVPAFGGGTDLSNVVQSISIGDRADDLSTELFIDATVDLGSELPRRATMLLAEGASEVYVRVRLKDGQVLGPKVLCQVKEQRRSSRRPASSISCTRP